VCVLSYVVNVCVLCICRSVFDFRVKVFEVSCQEGVTEVLRSLNTVHRGCTSEHCGFRQRRAAAQD
jgi:hypothetical protein